MKRILVVDDEPDITAGIKGCLGDKFNINTFNDPLEALSKFRQDAYDMALIDIKMRKMNGFELYKALYQLDSGIKFCFITAFEIKPLEFKKMFPSTKVAYILKKPFSPATLADLVEDALNCHPAAGSTSQY